MDSEETVPGAVISIKKNRPRSRRFPLHSSIRSKKSCSYFIRKVYETGPFTFPNDGETHLESGIGSTPAAVHTSLPFSHLMARATQLKRRLIAFGVRQTVLDSLSPCAKGAFVIRFLVATPQKQIPIIPNIGKMEQSHHDGARDQDQALQIDTNPKGGTR